MSCGSKGRGLTWKDQGPASPVRRLHSSALGHTVTLMHWTSGSIPAGARRAFLSVFCAHAYHLETSTLAALAKRASTYKDEKLSDHAPLSITYDFKL